MVDYDSILQQLAELGQTYYFFGKPELYELSRIMNEGEKICFSAFGFYQGGSGLIVATNCRLLLIDKKPFFLNLEDIRYEMINEADFAGRMLDAAIILHTGNKQLKFRSFSDVRLRKLFGFVQDQITRARQLEHLVEQTRPAGTEWRPYSMLLPRPKVQKFSQQTNFVSATRR